MQISRNALWLRAIGGLVLAWMLSACGGGAGGGAAPTNAPTAITFGPNPSVVAVGGQLFLRASAQWRDGSSSEITQQASWTSANPAVATVQASGGTVLGVAEGSTVISVSYQGVTGTYPLQVGAILEVIEILVRQDLGYLCSFRTEAVRSLHHDICVLNKPTRAVFHRDEYYKFDKWYYKNRVPFIVYADFEAYNKTMNEGNKFCEQLPFACGLYVHSDYPNLIHSGYSAQYGEDVLLK